MLRSFKSLVIPAVVSLISCRAGAPNDSNLRFTVADRNAKNFALVIGSPNNLPGVGRDVQNVSKMISESNLGYELITVNSATKSQIMDKAREVGGKISADSTVLFYFSGHGTESGQLVSQGEDLFTVKDVANSIKQGTSGGTFKRFIAIMDSCFSGQSVTGNEAMFLAGSKRPVSLDTFINGVIGGNGVDGLFNDSNSAGASGPRAGGTLAFEQGLVIAAASASQFSNDAGAIVGGVFTASLMNAIKSNSTETLEQILEKAKQLTATDSSDQTPVWKATPTSILQERFNQGANGGSQNTVPVVPSDTKPSNDQPPVQPDNQVPVPPTPVPDNNSEGGDFLQKLLQILQQVFE